MSQLRSTLRFAKRRGMLEEMQLRGLSVRTQETYLRAATQLVRYIGKSPEEISPEELRSYFVYLTNEKKAARASITIALCGIKFLYEQVLHEEWQRFGLVRPQKEHKLPVVLSVEEVRRALTAVKQAPYRVCLSTLYACGLRLQEGLHLQVRDIDSGRMQVHVRGGKGSKDRYVPLPERTLAMLRQHWLTHRDPIWLFPARDERGIGEIGGEADVRKRCAAGVAGRGAGKWAAQTCHGAHAASFMGDAPAGGGCESAPDPGLAGPQFAQDHGHLHPSDDEN